MVSAWPEEERKFMRTASPVARRYAKVLVVSTGFLIASVVVARPTLAFARSTNTILCSGGNYSSCTSRGYPDYGYDLHNKISYWQMTSGHNCTNYVAYVESRVDGVPTPPYNLGNADTWAIRAASHGIPVDNTPAIGSVAQWNAASWNGNAGHVAYVENVNTSNGSVTSITISEDSYPRGPFDWRTISAGSSAWPANFIHFPNFGSSIAAVRNADGRLELFGTNSADGIFHRWQVAPNGSWSGWSQMPGALTSVAATRNKDGRLEVFGTNAQGNIWDRWQLSPGGSWSAWKQIPGALTSVAAARNKDGRLELFGTNSRGNIYHRWQLTPGGSWSGWSQMPGSLTQVAAATNADGRIELFGVNSVGDIWHCWQLSPGGFWSAWKQFDG
ncbi:MAG: CHAP domain-containing protein, partial [Streptosporangiaceae bacterium]